MSRCAFRTLAALALATAAIAPALAQVRSFPPNTLRGTMVFGDFPQVTVNGQGATLSPGTRIRDENNRLLLPATINGAKFLVHYTVGLYGAQVQDVWVLRADEAAIKPWPRTLEEARTWAWDATTQTWTKP
ncbi:MAG: hypothetical protein M3O01_05165 [Pseudomonadota bacterium]|nr:hypothetical protein [Pseudomonadota bacterium]